MSDDKPKRMTLTFAEPIKFGGTTFASIELSEPKAGQMMRANGYSNPIESNIALIAEVAKVDRGVIEEMANSDFDTAVDFMASFTKAARKTGGGS